MRPHAMGIVLFACRSCRYNMVECELVQEWFASNFGKIGAFWKWRECDLVGTLLDCLIFAQNFFTPFPSLAASPHSGMHLLLKLLWRHRDSFNSDVTRTSRGWFHLEDKLAELDESCVWQRDDVTDTVTGRTWRKSCVNGAKYSWSFVLFSAFLCRVLVGQLRVEWIVPEGEVYLVIRRLFVFSTLLVFLQISKQPSGSALLYFVKLPPITARPLTHNAP